MKKLRILFLAVLAMAVMASVAFAGSDRLSFDIVSYDIGDGYVGFPAGAATKTVNVYLSGDQSSSITVKVHVYLSSDKVGSVSFDLISEDDSTQKNTVTVETTPADGKKTGLADSGDITIKITSAKKLTTQAKVKFTLTVNQSKDKEKKDTVTVNLTVSPDVSGVVDTVSPDVEDITFSPTSASVKVGATTTVTATLTVSNDAGTAFTSKDVDVTVTPKAKTIATAEKSGDVKVDGKTVTVTIKVTGVSADKTEVGVKAVIGTGKPFTKSFDVTVTAASSETDTTETVSPDIDWYSTSTAYAFNNKTWTLYLSKDKAGVTKTAAVKVSSDFTATPVFVISPDTSSYVKFTIGTATAKTASADTYNKVYTFDITATPVASTDTKGVGFTAYVTVTSSSKVVSTDALAFTVIVSDDTTTSGDKGSEGGSTITDWTLTATASKTEFNLSYYEKAEVTITARPADDGVDFVITNDADESDGYTLTSDDGNFSTTGYVVKYTFTAGETEGEFPIKFTVTATSGDDEQTESVDVVFTVEYDSSKASTIKPEEPTDLAAELGATDGKPVERSVGGHTFHIHSENDRKAMFAAGRGVVGWGVRAPFKVRKVFGQLGWWFRFLNAVAKAYFDLNAPATYGASTASIAADDGVASRDAALSVGFEDDYTAFFELDLEKAAATLPEGATYQANSSYTPDATADDGGAASDPMTAGELKGAKSSSGGEQGGGEQGGGEQGGGDDGKETIDNLLGGTSGGCDAGFGALALVLAATMIFVRKRS